MSWYEPPEDVARRTLELARGPIEGGIVSGVWEGWVGWFDDESSQRVRWALRFHNGDDFRRWCVNYAYPVGSDDRSFADWNAVRVALDEVEESGRWWP